MEFRILFRSKGWRLPLRFTTRMGGIFDDLISGKTPLAIETFPTAADAQPVVRPAGVHHFAFQITAKDIS